MNWTTAYVLVVVFVATSMHSGFGFGKALIAMPLLAFTLPVEVSTPLVVLLSTTVAFVMLLEDWHKVHFRSALGLVVSSFFGIPLGVWLLTSTDESLLKGILAVAIIGFSLYCLISRGRMELKNDRLAWVFGFVSGIMGGAYGINGPPLVIYGSLRRWTPERFRATLQGYFLPAGLFGMFMYWKEGLWVPDVTWYFLASLPVALAAIYVGRLINRGFKSSSFMVCIHAGLVVIGSVLLIQSIWKGLSKEPI